MTNPRCITCTVLAFVGIVVLGLWAVVWIALLTAGWKICELEDRYYRWRTRNKLAAGPEVKVERPHRFWLKGGGFFL